MTHYAYLYDSETPYITKLGGYLSINNSFPFVVKVCITRQELMERVNADVPKLLLIAEADYKSLGECRCEEVILLSEKKTGNYEGRRFINKYQSGERIVKDILSYIAESDSMSSIIIVGEVRGAEAMDMICSAMNCGHDGFNCSPRSRRYI